MARKRSKFFLNLISCYLVVALVGELVCGFLYCLGGESFSNFFENPKVYARGLNFIVLLLHNSGFTVVSLTLVFLLFLSLANHAVLGKEISIFSISVIAVDLIYVLVIEASYDFFDSELISFAGFSLPVLDWVAVVYLVWLIVLYVLDLIKG